MLQVRWVQGHHQEEQGANSPSGTLTATSYCSAVPLPPPQTRHLQHHQKILCNYIIYTRCARLIYNIPTRPLSANYQTTYLSLEARNAFQKS